VTPTLWWLPAAVSTTSVQDSTSHAPVERSPAARTRPLLVSARVWREPAATATTSRHRSTAHCPRRPFPAATAVPSALAATECQSPHVTLTTSRHGLTVHAPSRCRPTASTVPVLEEPERPAPTSGDAGHSTPRRHVALPVSVPARRQHRAVRAETDAVGAPGVRRRVHVARGDADDVVPVLHEALVRRALAGAEHRAVPTEHQRVPASSGDDGPGHAHSPLWHARSALDRTCGRAVRPSSADGTAARWAATPGAACRVRSARGVVSDGGAGAVRRTEPAPTARCASASPGTGGRGSGRTSAASQQNIVSLNWTT
jgi:hypothetical protein